MTEFQKKMIKKLKRIRELSNAEFVIGERGYYCNRCNENLLIVIAKNFVMFKVLDGISIYGDYIKYVRNEIWFYNEGHLVSMIPYHVFFGRGA